MWKCKFLSVVIALSLLVGGCAIAEASFANVQFISESGIPYGIAQENNRPYVIPTDLNLAIPAGNITGFTWSNKFGRNTEIDNGVTADIWDGGATGGASLIYAPPTTDRIHNLVSTDVSDNASGSGARIVTVYGLDDWHTIEISENVSMNGTTNVPTVNDYVFINRAEVVSNGSTTINAGTITVTAVTDGTVSAQIEIVGGQTQQAVVAFPSIQDAYMTSFYANANRTVTSAAAADVRLCVNSHPDTELTGFKIKNTSGLLTVGTSHFQHPYSPYFRINGPAIIKIQATSSADNMDVSAGFDVILVTNN